MIARFLKRQEGAAAVEFALVAPLLILSVLSMADIGLAVHSLFRIDQSLRNGAEAAIRDPGRARVLSVLGEVGATEAGPVAEWSVDRRCECPGAGEVSCREPVTCAGGRPTSIVYDIGGTRLHEGILMPDRPLSRTVSVQVR